VKEKNSTVWNWICTASDEFHCFFLFSPGSTGVRCERCELTFRMSLSLFVVYTVTRHAQTRTWGVQSQLQLHVLFSADLWMGKKKLEIWKVKQESYKISCTPLIFPFTRFLKGSYSIFTIMYHIWDKKRRAALFIQNSRYPHQNER